ncbi:UNVERIFIED_CONTAM: hypothetical protein GTU68_025938 [Idotea baltica]|nr:hypothetical protein [Idotea baltica]
MSTFLELGLKEPINKALTDLGYEKPTVIQEKAIPQIISSTDDLKAFAQTGTGKTAAFSLPILELLDPSSSNVQAIILSPTRELAVQIGNNIKDFCKYLKDVKVATVYGGSSIEDQIRSLKRGAQIVVGTPGRTVDLINRRALKLGNVQWLVLDEADEMLNMGFKEELDKVLEATPDTKQTLLFSATFPREDVAARGLDVNNLTHVINHKLPDQIENYNHRSGRTGRAGNTGISIVLVSNKDKGKLRPIERIIKKKFVETKVPSGKEICQNQLMHLIDKVQNIEVNETEINEFLPSIYDKLKDLDREELIQKFVSLEFNSFLSYYENAKDLNDLSSRDSSRGRTANENMSRFFINIGRKDQLNPAKLIGLINDQNIGDKIEIGAIDILDTFSFFEVDKNYESATLEAFSSNQPDFDGRSVNVEITKKDRSGGGGRKRGKKPFGKKDGGFGRRRSSEGSSRRNDDGGKRSSDRRSADRPKNSGDRKSGGFGRRRRER